MKRGGKQFRRLLKTKFRKPADRRQNDSRAELGSPKISPEAKLPFDRPANLWLATNKHPPGSNTVKHREMHIQRLAPHFQNLPIRDATEQDCDRWVKARRADVASDTFVHELDFMKTACGFTLERGLIRFNPPKHRAC